MLYVCHGSNYDSITEQIREITRGRIVVRYDASEIDYHALDGYIHGGLFDTNEAVILDECYTSSEHQEPLSERLSSMSQSSTPFIIVEQLLGKKQLTSLEEAGAVVTKHTKDRETTKNAFNTFVLADNYLSQDKRQLWVNYQRALRYDVSPEQIHGLLWWQLVNVIVVGEEGTNPGLKDFAFKKIKNNLNNISLERRYQHASQLVGVLHRARSGEGDLEDLLEEWILAL